MNQGLKWNSYELKTLLDSIRSIRSSFPWFVFKMLEFQAYAVQIISPTSIRAHPCITHYLFPFCGLKKQCKLDSSPTDPTKPPTRRDTAPPSCGLKLQCIGINSYPTYPTKPRLSPPTNQTTHPPWHSTLSPSCGLKMQCKSPNDLLPINQTSHPRWHSLLTTKTPRKHHEKDMLWYFHLVPHSL
jgi:hypothetical protein